MARDPQSPGLGGARPVVSGFAADMRPIDTPEHRPDTDDTAQLSSGDGLAQGRRLVALVVLTTCAWLVAFTVLWASTSPRSSEDVSPPVGDTTVSGVDQARRS